MKWRILVTAPPILPSIEDYKDIFNQNNAEIVLPPFDVKECLYEEDLHILLNNIDGIICGDDKLTKNVLEKTNKLKVISKWGSGIDSIDAEAANELGIKVFRVEGAFADPVADTVFAYILQFARRIYDKDKLVRNKGWGKIESFALKEKTLGVIGVGHIGKSIIKRAIGFGMKVYGNDIVPMPVDFIKATGITILSLSDLLAKSDIISLNCDLNSTSYHLIGKNEFNLMNSSVYLINTSRGAVIDESALEIALKTNRISGAALDVFEVEPLPHNSPLRNMDNVLISPHNANSSPAVFKKVNELSIKNLFTGLETN